MSLEPEPEEELPELLLPGLVAEPVLLVSVELVPEPLFVLVEVLAEPELVPVLLSLVLALEPDDVPPVPWSLPPWF